MTTLRRFRIPCAVLVAALTVCLPPVDRAGAATGPLGVYIGGGAVSSSHIVRRMAR